MKLPQLLAPPPLSGDATASMRSVIVHWTLVANIGLMSLLVLAAVVGGQLPEDIAWTGCCLALLSAVLLLAVHRGFVRLAAWVLLAVCFIVVTGIVARLGTIRVPAAGYYVALVFAAGLIFELRGMLLMVVLSAAAVGGLILAERAGWLPTPDYRVTITQWIVSCALFACVGGWTYAALRFIREGLQRAELELAEKKEAERKLQQNITELSIALSEVKMLSGLLPICCSCKRIRDDRNYWHQVESYISARSKATFTHGYCPECAQRFLAGMTGLKPPDDANRKAADAAKILRQ
ncbi:MAG: hypothetical protein HZA93_10325 [Verrucomicrobia bacterium]|nr:hypothetical protein [Verrucomicrobiota bacterium]